MKAVVIHDYETGARVEQVDVDRPQQGEVVVRLAASGVCGSDLHVLHGRSSAVTLPVVLGHEGAGVVEDVGPGVTGLAVGDHVVVALYGPCGTCRNCQVGRLTYCDGPARIQAIQGRMADGTTRLQQDGTPLHPFVGSGTLAEFAVIRASQAVRIDPEVPLDLLCLAGCGVTTGLGAVFNIARVRPGESVVVVGCGGVGLNVVQGARLSGAARVIGVDTNPAKLDLASDLGATHVVDSSRQDMAEEVGRIVPNGADHVFEVVGSPELVAEAFELTRPGGACVVVGSCPPGSTIPIDAGRLFMGQRRLLGCLGGDNIPHRDIPRIVDLYRSGQLELEKLVTQRLALDEVHKAFTDAESGAAARSVVVFDAAGGPRVGPS